MKKLIVGLSMASLHGCAAQQQSAAPSPAREPVATVQPAAQAERTEKQVIAAVDTDYSVLFARNSASLDEAATTLLRQHAERLKANPRQQVILAGFSDSVGSRAYSLALADGPVPHEVAALVAGAVHAQGWRLYALGFATRTLESVFAEISGQ